MKLVKNFHLLFGLLLSFNLPALAQITHLQSEFSGPLKLKVWKHWQASWNVELQTEVPFTFTLSRGYDSQNQAQVSLKYRTERENLRATIKSFFLRRNGEWGLAAAESAELSADGQRSADGQEQRFEFNNAEDFLDQSELRTVNKIHFEIYQNNEILLAEDLIPMYIRGKDAVYWNNPIESYQAHAGSGNISVATGTDTEKREAETWEGTLVNPNLNFIERNTLSAGAFIGLHRHERNQEIYMMDSGSAVMQMGRALVSSERYQTRRKWIASSDLAQGTTEFLAAGGWIESRELKPGQYTVIVPNPDRQDQVDFHGIRALSETIFLTLGTKN